MAKMYDQKKKNELCFHAMSLYNKALSIVQSDEDAGAVFTICLAMCLEEVEDEEDVREILHVVGSNCLSVWREYKEISDKYGIR